MTVTELNAMEHRDPEPAKPAAAIAADELKESLSAKLKRLLARQPRMLGLAWIVVVVLYLAVVPTAYVCWYLFPIELYQWTAPTWWHWLPAFFGFSVLFGVPIWVAVAASSVTGFVADLSLSIDEAVVRHAQQAVRHSEEQAISRLEKNDDSGLLPLLKYSRAQLDAYYTVGLSQTRRSFANSVLAMWLGFILLLVGIALYVVPVEQFGMKAPTQDFRILIMGGSAIIEFISALFLWVYRSSTIQLTYFYNRQMYSHTAIMSYRIAKTMDGAKSDDAKRAIIDRILNWTTMPDLPATASHTLGAAVARRTASQPHEDFMHD